MVTDVEQRGQILHFLIPTKITEGMGEMSKWIFHATLRTQPLMGCQLASCLINARQLPAHPAAYCNGLYTGLALCTFCSQVIVWVRSLIKPDLFDNNVPFDNTTPIYLINLLWKLWLGFGLDSEFPYFGIFHGE